MRDQVKVVMRYAGPRMLWHHPILALFHILDGLKRNSATGFVALGCFLAAMNVAFCAGPDKVSVSRATG
jgi:hypothetical protein